MTPPRPNVQTNDAFRYHWAVWRLTGIEAPPHVRRPLYVCYALFVNAVVTVFFPLTLLANLFHTHNLPQLCENLTITITDTIANLKFLNVFCVRRKLLLIKDMLVRLDRRASSRAETAILRQVVRTAQNSFRIFWTIYTLGTVLSLVKVAIAPERILLFPAWFYVDWRHSDTAYACVFTYQLVALIVQAGQDCANDSYPPSYLCVLTGHMKALQLRVRRIGTLAQRSSSELLPAPPSERALERSYRELLACIRDHANILELHGIIQHIISLACLAQFVCSALVQCTVGLHFLYVVDEHDLSAQMLSIIFFVAVTLEVFIVCYFSHCMQEQSEAFTVAFFSCHWIDQLPAFKRNLIIVLLRTQKPCQIVAGKYIAVDMPTFLKLMKYSYSVFTLLIRFK